MIFQEISEELRREFSRPVESHRGDDFTERGENILVNELLPEVLEEYEREIRDRIKHEAGALDAKGKRVKQQYLEGRGPGLRYSSNPDITLKGPRILDKETRLHLNTADMLKDGSTPVADERQQLLRLRDNLRPGEMAAALPKLRPGMDESEFRGRAKAMLRDAVRRWIGAP